MNTWIVIRRKCPFICGNVNEGVSSYIIMETLGFHTISTMWCILSLSYISYIILQTLPDKNKNNSKTISRLIPRPRTQELQLTSLKSISLIHGRSKLTMTKVFLGHLLNSLFIQSRIFAKNLTRMIKASFSTSGVFISDTNVA